MRQGQITVFLLFGVVLVLIATLLLTSRKPTPLEESTVIRAPIARLPQEIQPFVEFCLTQVTSQGIEYISGQGGFYPPLSLGSLQVGPRVIPYYMDRGRDRTPSIGLVQASLRAYIHERVDGCVRDFEDFTKRGYSFSRPQAPNASVIILQDKVLVDLYYLFEASSPVQTQIFDRFVTQVDSDLWHRHALAVDVLQAQYLKSNEVLLSTIAQVSRQHDLKVHLEYHNESVVYSITNPRDDLALPPKEFTFAIRYEWGESP